MMCRIAEAQNSMCESISRGNINQIGRNAWASMIDLVQEMVLDFANDARVEYMDEEADDLKSEISDKDTKRKEYKKRKGAETEKELKNDPDYNKIVDDVRKLEKQYDTTVHKATFPQFVNQSVPNYMYSHTYNNSWDLCFGYMTTCMTSKAIEKWYEDGAERADNNSIDIVHPRRLAAKEGIRTLSETFEQNSYYTCSSLECYTCPLPNAKKTPDIVVAILPEDRMNYLKIPIFVFEVIGQKEIRGKGEREFAGFLATMQCLAFSPYAYYGEVDDETVSLYHFQKVPDEGRIAVTLKKYRYADRERLRGAFEEIIEVLSQIFLDIYINLSWINHESSRLLKLAGYKDFIATLDGNPKGVEMHCWHLFAPKFFSQDKLRAIPEYLPRDKYDPKMPDNEKDEKIENGEYKLEADELVPVVSSTASRNEINLNERLIATKGGKVLKHPTSRAVRNPVTGEPTDPNNPLNWNAAFNQFRADIGGFVEMEKSRDEETDRTAIPTRAQTLNTNQFDAIFNPNIQQPSLSVRKMALTTNPNILETDRYEMDEEAIAEEVDDDADNESWNRAGIETVPDVEYVGPTGQVYRGPPSGPVYRGMYRPREPPEGKYI